MKKIVVIGLVLSVLFFAAPHASFAQMMGDYSGQATPTQSDLQDEQNMQNAGLKIYQELQSGKITCQNLTSDNYEKLGEYFMGQSAGSTQNHVYWDQRIQSMMGDSGDTQMHIVWGERGSGCLTNAPIPSNAPSFLNGMMNYQGSNTTKGGGSYPMMGLGDGYGYGGMMNGNFGWGFATLGFLFWLAAFTDLILLGIFLWKRLRK